jgi:hypothetical protein
MKANPKRLMLIPALLTGVVVSGCSGRSIHITRIGDIANQHVRVDVVGVNWMEKKQWENTSMQDYWTPGNQRRQDSLAQGYNHSVKFEPAKPYDIVIRERDPIWKTWRERGATHFFVMFDTCTDPSAWSVCLPLAPKYWRGRTQKDTIEIHLQPSGIVLKTSPKPGWQ